MYRQADGTRRFSFTRFMNNVAPVMLHDSTKDPGHMALSQKDRFFSYQTERPECGAYGLDEISLYVAGIIDTASVSKRVLQKLQKCGVVSAPEGLIDTTRIDKNFTHNIAIVSAVRQKQIIDLLFWWEEECMRLRKLEAEKLELQNIVLASGTTSIYSQLLQRVQQKLAAKPSGRDDAVEKDEDQLMVDFRNGRTDVQQIISRDELPPDYAPRGFRN